MSMYPNHIRAIRKGKKKYEFRKSFPSKKTERKLRNEQYIAVYETIPTSAITIVLKVGDMTERNVEVLWTKFGKYAGISKDYFMNYYEGKRNGVAIEIRDFLVLKKPIKLSAIRKKYPSFMPPQNIYYLSEERYSYIYKELLDNVLNNVF